MNPVKRHMLRFFKRYGAVILAAATVHSASAFSLLGLPHAWQTERIGYMLPGDLGAPMELGQGYRWNFWPMTYGFDKSFKDYFGQRGCDEVRKAMKMLNDLPAFSKTSASLTEFPTSTRRVNYRASGLGMYDLKSMALAAMMEQLGLASPERYVWCISDLFTAPPAYGVIMRNFDPATWAPSRYVNDTMYTYYIYDDTQVADCVEVPVDPLAFQHTSVADIMGGAWGGFLNYGDYLTGLTRDDIGGLRYLYAGKGQYVVYHMEGLVSDAITNMVGGGGGSPWTPVGTGTPVIGTALRAGPDKLQFTEVEYDSTLGNMGVQTNSYKETIVVNGRKIKQRYQRLVAEPDIIFGAGDLANTVIFRSVLDTFWVDNAALNGQVLNGGPGTLEPPYFIIFNKTGPYYINFPPDFLDEQTAQFNFVWGSFDGTTNEPFVYPQNSTIAELEARVLGGN
jgi:hypothetical protein